MKSIVSFLSFALIATSLTTGPALADTTTPMSVSSGSAASSAPEMDRHKRHQEHLEHHFDKMDANHDGMVSKDEFMKAHQDDHDGHRHHHDDHDGKKRDNHMTTSSSSSMSH